MNSSSSPLGNTVILSNFSSGNFSNLPAGFHFTFIAAIVTTLVVTEVEKFDISVNSHSLPIPPDTSGFFFPLEHTQLTMRARTIIEFFHYFAYPFPTDCYETYISTGASESLKIRPVRSEAENKQICFLHLFSGHGTVNLSIPTSRSRITISPINQSNASISVYHESTSLRKRHSPALFSILVGLDERHSFTIGIKMKGNHKSAVIRLRYGKMDVENGAEIAPLINLSAYSPVTEEDLFDVRFSKLKMQTLSTQRTQLNHRSDNLTVSLNLTNGMKKGSGKYILVFGAIFGLVELVILIGLYAIPAIQAKSTFVRGTSHTNVPSVFLAHGHNHPVSRPGEKNRI
jgi:hypothetical protein